MSKKYSMLPYREKAFELLNKMTLEEKIGQLVLFASLKNEKYNYIKQGRVGGLLNVWGAYKVNELQRIAVEETRLKIPLLIGDDVIHGFKTTFPIPLATASSWDLEKIEEGEKIAAMEANAGGINWIYAPMVDISRDPRWGRVAEGAGEDPYLGSEIAKARVRGFQSINPNTNYPYVASCIKHFAGYGLSEGGRDYDACDISERTLHSTYMPPYKAAIDEGAMSIMSSFNSLNGDPVTGSKGFLTDLLRGLYGFEGLVVSDFESIMELIYHRVVKDRKDAAKVGIMAGCDIDMHSGVYIENLEELVNENIELIKCINESVVRVLCVKFALGLFENPYVNPQKEEIWLNDEFRLKSRDMARRSMVLLKNQNNILPLKKGIKILVTGPLADSHRDMLGMWSCKGDQWDVVTLRHALEQDSDIVASYIKGTEIEKACRCDFEESKRLASESDVIIYVCGEPEGMTGEIHCRSEISMPGIQDEYLDVLKSTGKPVVAILMTGRPLACTHLDEKADAILLAWHLGIEAGNACHDVLFGEYAPAGKLPITFPKATGQIPVYYSRLSSGRPYEMFKRYLDVDVSPLYPFGYGLSYAKFKYNNIHIETPTIKEGEYLRVSVKVSNISNIDSEEVVQVYFCDLISSIATPLRRLCEFEKIMINANSTVLVEFKIPSSRFTFLNQKLEPVLEAGEFEIYIGSDSSCELKTTFNVITSVKF